MKTSINLITMALFAAILFTVAVSISSADSPPLVPNTFSGTIKFASSSGQFDAPAGTLVEALIDNVTKGSTTVITSGIYMIDVTGTDDDDGKDITFRVNNLNAGQKEVFNASMPPPRTLNLIINLSEQVTFDTEQGGYPSIMGTHNGTIKLNKNLTVLRLYTYPSPGTGGHSEYVRIWNSTWNITANWSGYTGDWRNITFSQPFTLTANETYYYTIRTGSYPQIIHAPSFSNSMGTITSTGFVDANGRRYSGWIPALRLE